MAMTQSLVLAMLLACSFAATRTTLNDAIVTDRPIVGVFALPSEFKVRDAEEYNYIGSSYIKWVEQSGARAMPIPYDLTEAELDTMLTFVNGLIFPGGFWYIFEDAEHEVGFTQLAKSAIHLLKRAKEFNDRGDYFPVYGIQSGMQLIVAALASDGEGTNKLFDKFKTENWATSLKYMRNATDHMWSFQQPETIEYTSNNDAVLYYSDYTLSIVKFLRNDLLRDMFDITAMSKDEAGQQFVSALQAKGYPIFGTQFFSQGNSFEWKPKLHLNHHPRTIDFQQQLSNFFVQNSRKSSHTYELDADDEDDQLMMYNFPTEKVNNDYFETIHFIHKMEFKTRLYKAAERIAMKTQEKEMQKTQ